MTSRLLTDGLLRKELALLIHERIPSEVNDVYAITGFAREGVVDGVILAHATFGKLRVDLAVDPRDFRRCIYNFSERYLKVAAISLTTPEPEGSKPGGEKNG